MGISPPVVLHSLIQEIATAHGPLNDMDAADKRSAEALLVIQLRFGRIKLYERRKVLQNFLRIHIVICGGCHIVIRGITKCDNGVPILRTEIDGQRCWHTGIEVGT